MCEWLLLYDPTLRTENTTHSVPSPYSVAIPPDRVKDCTRHQQESERKVGFWEEAFISRPGRGFRLWDRDRVTTVRLRPGPLAEDK